MDFSKSIHEDFANHAREIYLAELDEYVKANSLKLVAGKCGSVIVTKCMFCERYFDEELYGYPCSFRNLIDSIPPITMCCQGCKRNLEVSSTFAHIESLALPVSYAFFSELARTLLLPNYEGNKRCGHVRLSRTLGRMVIQIERIDTLTIKNYFLDELETINPGLGQSIIDHVVPMEGYPKGLMELLISRIPTSGVPKVDETTNITPPYQAQNKSGPIPM